MFRYLFKNVWRRMLFAVLFGIFARLILEVMFSLQYKTYSILQNLDNYAGTIILTWLIVETIYWINRILDQKLPWYSKPKKRLIVQLVIHLILALLIISGVRVLFIIIAGTATFILLSDEIIIILLTLFFVLALNLFDFVGVLLNQWRISLAEAEKYNKESAEFEFEMLRAQVNPHFLFNSLNTLSSLVYEDQDKAAGFIRELSDVYRHVLDNRKKEVVSLKEEVDFIKSYVYLLELRFGEKFKVNFEIDNKYLDKMIAPLTLQMLIENAVKHNVISEKNPLFVSIKSIDNMLIVENNLQKKKMMEKSTGMGLQNISSRYRNLSTIIVRIEEDENSFKVIIPLI